MNKKSPLPLILEDVLDTLGGPPTDWYQAEIDAAAKQMKAGMGTSAGGRKRAAASKETDRAWAILAATEAALMLEEVAL